MPQLRFNPIPFLSIYIKWILRSRTKTAITSSLPKTMTNDRIYFTKGVNPAKLPAGPVASVRPRPELVILPATAPSAVTKSTPVMEIISVNSIMASKKPNAMTNTEETILSSMTFPPAFITVTWLGERELVAFFLKKAIMTCQRKILIEPVVEPVQPPCRNKMKKTATAHVPHWIKSYEEKPVVVIAEIILKEALRNAVTNGMSEV